MKSTYFYFVLLLSLNSLGQNLFISSQIPREKVYLSINKPFYVAGDSIFVEVSVADARTLKSDTLSVPLYLELIDNNKKVAVERWILKLINNQAKIRIKIPDNFNTDYYQLRAYTNYMRNFTPDAFANLDVLIFNINYKETFPDISPEESVASLEVSLESGSSCVAGLVNNLMINTKDNFKKGIKSVVLLKSESETIRVFETDENGVALVEFEPKNGKKYFLETGIIKTEIPFASNEGTVLRGYFVNEGKKLAVNIQSNLTDKSPLKLVIQTRGQILQTLLIKPKEGVVKLNFTTDSLPDGILNMALIDNYDKILAERIFAIAHKDQNEQQNYFLYNSELKNPIESTNHFYTEIGKANTELIGKKNLLYSFDQFVKTNLQYKNELGISISGKVIDKSIEKKENLVSVSLIVIPERNDTIQKEQLLVASPDKNAIFTFENLDFYGKPELKLKATSGKEELNVELIKDSIPTIFIKNNLIDWRRFKTNEQIQSLEREANHVFANIALEERIKIEELNEVTVFTKNTLRSPVSIFKSDPSIRFLPAKITMFGAGSQFKDFFKNRVSYRLRKYPNPILKYYVDDILTPEDIIFEMPNSQLAYVDVHDGTSDSFTAGASILVNIYTIGYSINPMVSKVMEVNRRSFAIKTQREGYYASK